MMKIPLLNNDLNETSCIDGDDENNRWYSSWNKT